MDFIEAARTAKNYEEFLRLTGSNDDGFIKRIYVNSKNAVKEENYNGGFKTPLDLEREKYEC